MMHVVYCFDHRYEQHFGASVVSLLLHLGGPGSELCVHVVTADPSDGFQARLDRLTDRFRARITVHRVHAQDVAQVSNLQLMKTPTGHLTAATYYRVLLGSILPPDIDRVLYLDADTIVLSDLRPLFERDLGAAVIGAALDRGSAQMAAKRGLARYVNSGVLVMDLQRWRQGDFARRCLDFAARHPEQISYGDQCAINVVCADDVQVLEPRWNRFVVAQTPSDDAGDAAILHYITGDKPWHAWYENDLSFHYWRYLDVSPWAGAVPVAPTHVGEARRLARLRFAQGKPQESVAIYEQILKSLNKS
jgi:lipopolysaccharide biosynthesis glycosyltransferase